MHSPRNNTHNKTHLDLSTIEPDLVHKRKITLNKMLESLRDSNDSGVFESENNTFMHAKNHLQVSDNVSLNLPGIYNK
jgi:hypothetical protein